MAEILRYVNTDNAGTEDGTSVATGYATMATMEANEQQDLTDGGGDTFVCLYSGTTADSTAVTFDGWTTSTDNRIVNRGNPDEADGLNTGSAFSTSHYRIGGIANSSSVLVLEDFVTFDGLQFFIDDTPNGQHRCIEYALIGATNKLTVQNCRFRNTSSNAGNRFDQHAFVLNDPDQIVEIKNCAFEWKHFFADYTIYILAGGTINIIGNTIEGGSDGIHVTSGFSAGTLTIKNNAIFNSNGADLTDSSSGGTVTVDYNATDDSAARGSNGVDISPGATESDGWNAAVTDYANGDYTLKDSDSVLFDAGDTVGLDTDILGTSRPQGAAYDIGAFELEVAGAASVGSGLHNPLLASVGTMMVR